MGLCYQVKLLSVFQQLVAIHSSNYHTIGMVEVENVNNLSQDVLSLIDSELRLRQVCVQDEANSVLRDYVKMALFANPCFLICTELVVPLLHVHAFCHLLFLSLENFMIGILVLAPDDKLFTHHMLSKKVFDVVVFILEEELGARFGKGS